MRRRLIGTVLPLLFIATGLGAQQVPPPPMQHTPGMRHHGSAPQATQTGQAAFAAISEIVKLLEADRATDWSKVDLEALRQHLIDMDAVTMRARVHPTRTEGGLAMEITGDPQVAAAARRMVSAHAPMLDQMGGWRATTAPMPSGIRMTVVASDPADTATVARIRGLGFIGLMTEGAHHTEHHLMIATGAGAHAHGKP